MSLTNKALFIIERNLAESLSLGWVAKQCGASPFHLLRAFGEATGFSLMDYVRGRRLTLAAHRLAAGADDILAIALDQHYSSHEAFSRAFKSRFGKTPDEVRRSRSIEGLSLVEPIRRKEGMTMPLKEPQIRTERELKFVGLSRKVPYSDMQTIAGQWQRFMSDFYGEIEDKSAEPPVGVVTASDETSIEYICAAGVTRIGSIPLGCTKIILAPAIYAVFAHDRHIAEVRDTYNAIWNEWFPKSGMIPAEAPGLERHNPTFDPRTGEGGITIWLPIES